MTLPANMTYPDGGLAHIISDIAHLVSPRLRDKRELHLIVSAQPNSHPHLGTITTLMTAYAVGNHLRNTFGLPTTITLDILENSPSPRGKVFENGVLYQKSLQDTFYDDGRPLATFYLESFQDLLMRMTKRTGLPYQIRSYEEVQHLPVFRRSLVHIMRNAETFACILSPSEQRIAVRFPCPICRYVDKHIATTHIVEVGADSVTLESSCFEHGIHRLYLSETSTGFVDTNAALRDVVKSALVLEEERTTDRLGIIVDGGDWGGTWALQVFARGVVALGYTDFPVKLFAPVIVDWSGGKFSKSLHVQQNAYAYLPPGFSDSTQFLATYGEAGLDTLWQEISTWASDPKRLQRNYSVAYFQHLLEGYEKGS